MAEPANKAKQLVADSPVLQNSKWMIHRGIWIAIALASIPFLYGKVLEFRFDGPFDGARAVYDAQMILHGGKLRQDYVPTAGPAMLLINVLGVGFFGYSELGPELFQFLFQATALGLMFFTLRKVYGLIPAAAGLFLAAFFLSAPPYCKYGNVKEQFMIACMVISACGMMRYHLGEGWRWMLLAGAFGVNTYFFKPTGVSVILAMLVFVLIQRIRNRRSWRQFAGDITGLLAGGGMGLAPLLFFYAWQGEFIYFLNKIPLLNDVLGFFMEGVHRRTSEIVGGGAYIQGSQEVSDFQSQFQEVMIRYHDFLIPIGCSLFVVFGSIGRMVRRRLRAGDAAGAPGGKPAENGNHEEFTLFFLVWWLLDMGFVWISPRSYVEYYLPLNSSAAMLSAVAMSRCRKHILGYIGLMGCWAFSQWILIGLSWIPDFPYLTWQCRWEKGYGVFFLLHALPLAGAFLLYWGMRSPRLLGIRRVLILLLFGGMFLWWIAPHGIQFYKRTMLLREMYADGKQAPWQSVGQYIRDHSGPEDRIYVWGWYAGIYMASQRLSPVRMSCYGDMHAEPPNVVAGRIREFLLEMEAAPPEFIVDTQAAHYPIRAHPIFDLWPRWDNAHKARLSLRYSPYEPLDEDLWMSYPEMEKYGSKLFLDVENYTYALLEHPERPGGPMDPRRARELAVEERKRHEAMQPLREYVMKHYEFVPGPFLPHFVYRRISDTKGGRR